MSAYRFALRVELDLKIFAEAGGIVVSQCFRITERFEQRVRGQHGILHVLDRSVIAARDVGNVLHYPLCGLGFASTRLAGDDDTLILLVCLHVVVRGLGNGKDVRRDL